VLEDLALKKETTVKHKTAGNCRFERPNDILRFYASTRV